MLSKILLPIHLMFSGRDKSNWERPFEELRGKWTEIPLSGSRRCLSSDLAILSDSELAHLWERERYYFTSGRGFSEKGWFTELYLDYFRGKEILDIGSGLALDSLGWAMNGAKLTFADVSESSLEAVKRLCNYYEVSASFVLVEDISTIGKLRSRYDVITAISSLHHAPAKVLKPEYLALASLLNSGGRWLQLAYPKSRWVKEGFLPFHIWGKATDGLSTQWAEWYNTEKLLKQLKPYNFELVFTTEFGKGKFNWFDLKKVN